MRGLHRADSSGGLQFLIPTITAAHYFATDTNGWARMFHGFIPRWIAQSDPVALKNFYEGGAALELSRWATQIAVWSAFLVVFASSALCLSLILRKQWIENEHLPFPTVALPLEIARDDTPIFRAPLFWIGAGSTFAIVCLNTLSLNYPNIPSISLRGVDISTSLATPPWNAISPMPMTFFPFAIGIGYLLSTEVVFSCWFFYLFSKAQVIWGTAAGWTGGPVSGAQSAFPYLAYQGAGSFVGIAIFSVWVSRRHLAHVFRTAFTRGPQEDPDARGYKIAVFGLIACVMAMISFSMAAGASRPVSAIFVIIVLAYLLASTRMRAETGSAWPMGPDVDAFRMMVTVAGTNALGAGNLTALTYIRAATAGQDLRGVCMPNEMDGLKIADSAGIEPGKLAGAMVIAIGFGVVISFIIALAVWNKYGALAKTDTWRSLAGRASFDQLRTWLMAPAPPDKGGMMGIGAGLAFTMFLAYMRMRFVWWPFHPLGYCMSNTFTAYSMWMPFLIAWICKVVITRAGGMKLYRQALPFFLGMMAGDFIGGGLTTLIGCFTSINVYPMNW